MLLLIRPLKIFILGLALSSPHLAHAQLSVSPSINLYPVEALKAPPINEGEIQRFLKTVPDYNEHLNKIMAKIKRELEPLPTTTSLLRDLETGKPPPIPIPQKIRQFYEKYFNKYETTSAFCLEPTLFNMMIVEVSPEIRWFAKAMTPIINKYGWSDPKDFVRVQYQATIYLLNLQTLKQLEDAEHEMVKLLEEMKKSRGPNSNLSEAKGFIKKKFDPKVCRAILNGYLNPEVVKLVRKHKKELDTAIKLLGI